MYRRHLTIDIVYSPDLVNMLTIVRIEDSERDWSEIPFRAYRFLYVPPGLTSKNLRDDHIVYICSAWISEQAANFSLCSIHRLDFITEAENVYSAVRAESLYIIDSFVFKG